MDTRQQRKRMSSENRGQTGLGYVESRLRKTIVNPTVKHLRDAIIYFMKEIDRLNEVRTANATPIPHVAFDLRKRDGKQVGVQHFQVPAEHTDKLIEALTGIYVAEVDDLKRRLTNLESYNEKD